MEARYMPDGPRMRAGVSVTDAARHIEPLIGADQAAAILGVTVDWLYRQAAANKIPSYLLGGRKFKASELEAFIEAHRQGKMATVTPISRRR